MVLILHFELSSMIRFFISSLFSLTDAGFTKSGEVKLTSAGGYAIAFKKETKFSPFEKWRRILRLEDGPESPFIFDTDGTNTENAKVYFINGEERFERRKLKLSKDSLLILADQFGNERAFKITNNTFSRILRRLDKTGLAIPVTAEKENDTPFAATCRSCSVI